MFVGPVLPVAVARPDAHAPFLDWVATGLPADLFVMFPGQSGIGLGPVGAEFLGGGEPLVEGWNFPPRSLLRFTHRGACRPCMCIQSYLIYLLYLLFSIGYGWVVSDREEKIEKI